MSKIKTNAPQAEPMAGEVETGTAADVEALMKKYDRESNTRVWEGTPKKVVGLLMAAFSLYCIYTTLFVTTQLEVRLSMFLGCIIVMGYLNFPLRKHHVRPNSMPWYDIVLMVLGSGSFFYCAANVDRLIKMDYAVM